MSTQIYYYQTDFITVTMVILMNAVMVVVVCDKGEVG